MRFTVLLILFTLTRIHGFSQTAKDDTSGVNTDELENILRSNQAVAPSASGHALAAFQSTRIINGQSIENVGRGALDFRISHRFGQLNEGIKNLFGLDNATTKFDFDYGITDWLMVGVGRNSFEKEYDGFVKIKIFRQTVDDKMPLSISYCGGSSVRTLDAVSIPGFDYAFHDRLYFFNQLLLARKFSKTLSLQLMPTHIHYNLVAVKKDPNDLLALGIGGRLKVSKRIALTAEYYYVLPGFKMNGYNNSVSLGIDIETGGHVFQLFLTNSAAISERAFIGETQGDILKGAIHLGFNISRVFTIVRPHEFDKMGQRLW